MRDWAACGEAAGLGQMERWAGGGERQSWVAAGVAGLGWVAGLGRSGGRCGGRAGRYTKC